MTMAFIDMQGSRAMVSWYQEIDDHTDGKPTRVQRVEFQSKHIQGIKIEQVGMSLSCEQGTNTGGVVTRDTVL